MVITPEQLKALSLVFFAGVFLGFLLMILWHRMRE